MSDAAKTVGTAPSVDELLSYLNAAPDALFVVSDDGLIRYATSQLCALFGYSEAELVGQPVELLMPRRFRPRHREHMRRFLQDPALRDMGSGLDLWGLTRDGVEFPIDVRLSPVESRDSTHVVATVRDATGRHLVERSLWNILETSLNEIYLFDASSLRFVQVNRGARHNLGYTMSELEQMTPVDVKPEFTVEAFEAMIAPLRSGNRRLLVFESVHKRKDGSLYPVEVHLQKMQLDTSSVFVAIILDLTERRRSQSIDEARTKVLEHIAAGHDLDDVLAKLCSITETQAPQLRVSVRTLESPGVLRFRCAPSLPDSFVEAHDSDGIQSETSCCAIAATERRLVVVEDIESQGLCDRERKLARQSGLRACWSEPILSAEGEVLGTVVSYLDEARRPTEAEVALLHNANSLACIALERAAAAQKLEEANEDLERRVLERTDDLNATLQQLQLAKDEAERATTTKSRFLAAASHDLRQPLQSLGLYLSALDLQEDPRGAAEIRSKMRGSLETMGDLLGALLDISKLDSGSVTPEERDFSLGDLLTTVAHQARPHAEAKGLELEIVLDGSPCIAHTDPTLLQRVVENFVGNAIRYTQTGGIQLVCRSSGEAARVEVVDSGPGIPKHELETIFEEYYQLENPSRDRDKGLGLGLAIAKHIGRLLDLRLDVRSEIGRGSTFSVEVPLGTGVAESAPEADDVLTGSSTATRVLLIDDDPAVLDSTSILLEVLGFELETAEDGSAALEAIRAGGPPDVVVTDFRLPGMSGVEVIEQIRAAVGRAVPAIIMTGDTTGVGSLGIECCEVLNKPVDADELIELIHQSVGAKEG